MTDKLQSGAAAYGVRLSDGQLAAFDRYQSLLGAWSQHTNLVGNADAAVVEQRHFLESIALGGALRERQLLHPAMRIADVGAGAGFPGAVWKIVWPSLNVTLIEATARKTAFLSALVEILGFDEGADVITGRAEELAHDPALRASFDIVVARAVAPLATLLELTLPFARIGGRVIAPKGSRAPAEVSAAAHALQVLGGRAFVVPFPVAGPPQSIVAVLKERETPAAYPRRPGVPRRSPL